MYHQGIHLLTAFIIGLGMLAIFSLQQPTSADFSLQQTSTPNPRPFNKIIWDENCSHPCWWGLTINVSDTEDVDAFFQTYFQDNESGSYQDENHIIYFGQLNTIDQNNLEEWMLGEGYNYFDFRVIVNAETDKVEYILITIPLAQLHTIDWSVYSPSNILKLYGTPDEISHEDPPISGSSSSKLVYRYFLKGLFISYPIVSTYHNGRYTFCNQLNDTSGFIRIWIESQNATKYDFPNSLWQSLRDGWIYERPIQEILGMDKDDFTELFSKAERVCVTTLNEQIWDKYFG